MNAQLDIFGSAHTILPTTGVVWEIADTGSGWCDYCSIVALLIHDPARDRWVPECCFFFCEGCEEAEPMDDRQSCDYCRSCCSHYSCGSCGTCCDDICGNCECCESCCECFYCYGGDHKVSELACEDHCQTHCTCSPECCDCGCGGCGDSYCDTCSGPDLSEAVVPGWDRRGDAAPSPYVDVTSLSDEIAPAAPVSMMADFYLSEWCAVVSRDPSIRRDARTLQSAIVAACDGAFREYVFAAIGGELRHHCNVSLGGSRSTSWDVWRRMGASGDRVQLIRDAVEIFGCDTWSSGYGGRAWQICAEVLLARETGKLDARAFVDRVFSLQHNGGSLLNKASWNGGDVFWCRDIGNAHAATQTGLATLWTYASDDGRGILARTSLSAATDEQRADLAHAQRETIVSDSAVWTSATWLHATNNSTTEDTYAAALREQEARTAALEEIRDRVASGVLVQFSDESAWQYNARIHSLYEDMADGSYDRAVHAMGCY